MSIAADISRADIVLYQMVDNGLVVIAHATVSYTHLRAHETVLDLVCRLLLEKTKKKRLTTYHMPRHYNDLER